MREGLRADSVLTKIRLVNAVRGLRHPRYSTEALEDLEAMRVARILTRNSRGHPRSAELTALGRRLRSLALAQGD